MSYISSSGTNNGNNSGETRKLLCGAQQNIFLTNTFFLSL